MRLQTGFLTVALLLLPVSAFAQARSDQNQTQAGREGPKPDRQEPPYARAQASWDALVRQCANVGTQFRGIFCGGLGTPTPALDWATGQILAAALDLGMITGNYEPFERAVQPLDRYLLRKAGTVGYAPPVDPPPNAVRWWDENAAVSILLLQAFEQLHNPVYLSKVQALWPFFEAGRKRPGGEAENEKILASGAWGIPSTAWSDEVALLLYLSTHEDKYLTFARDNDEWVKRTLGTPAHLYYSSWIDNPKNGSFYDPKTGSACMYGGGAYPPLPPLPPPPPNVCRWVVIMNQGLMIGSDLLFYRATGDQKYLNSSVETADATLDYYTPVWLWRMPPGLNVVFFRNLMDLDTAAPHPRYRAVFQAYLNRAWTQARDPNTGFFTNGGIGQYNSKVGNALDQAAMIQMFAIAEWPQDQRHLLH